MLLSRYTAYASMHGYAQTSSTSLDDRLTENRTPARTNQSNPNPNNFGGIGGYRLMTSTTSSSSNTAKRITKSALEKSSRLRAGATIGGCSIAAALFGLSIYVRRFRDEKLKHLPQTTVNTMERDLEDVSMTVERVGLLSSPGIWSVKKELEKIRKWHDEKGYRGNLIIRELGVPFWRRSGSAEEEKTSDDGVVVEDVESGHTLQRWCASRSHKKNRMICEVYYIYSEKMECGKVLQQIFCQGTALLAMRTAIKSIYIWDKELECNLHWGFLDYANKLLQDLEPILAHAKSSENVVIELCGHSLGGAVAQIVALKLKKRGYDVNKVTAVGAPKPFDTKAIKVLRNLLPQDTLRVDNDRDFVCHFPPHGAVLGNKMWLIANSVRYASFNDILTRHKWVDSFFVNCFPLEIALDMVASLGKTRDMFASHRVWHYVKRIKKFMPSRFKSEEGTEEVVVVAQADGGSNSTSGDLGHHETMDIQMVEQLDDSNEEVGDSGSNNAGSSDENQHEGRRKARQHS
eukprot:CAMPEP_0196802182 /NCGR_PEP_ID=MMETSP1362-20130617/1847_1 /TAXON_ID=163516 /ORGANISM="Leptocylindrus danicus, Strain CCMP1856" /LENGTH=516 /DNA_ID=CAMNT_0042173413 /DNA_START=90 /DNA_END=1640 /DNA_ORIENTATION=-